MEFAKALLGFHPAGMAEPEIGDLFHHLKIASRVSP